MITVINDEPIHCVGKTKLEKLCPHYTGHDPQCTTFIGQCGSGQENDLYLITWDRIVLLSDPVRSWSTQSCPVQVDQYVDLEIRIV